MSVIRLRRGGPAQSRWPDTRPPRVVHQSPTDQHMAATAAEVATDKTIRKIVGNGSTCVAADSITARVS
jgi:hypothetical protein